VGGAREKGTLKGKHGNRENFSLRSPPGELKKEGAVAGCSDEENSQRTRGETFGKPPRLAIAFGKSEATVLGKFGERLHRKL